MSRFEIGMCPSEIRDNSVEYEYNETAVNGTTGSITIFLCPNGKRCNHGEFVTIGMCPTGEVCGCEYVVEDLKWEDNGSCVIDMTWTNPDRCILQKIELLEYNWWTGFTTLKYSHERIGERGNKIYPEGDYRNDQICRGCGLGGEDDNSTGEELIHITANLIPGQVYTVQGYFRDASCGGVSQAVTLAQVLYTATGFSSGRIVSQSQVHPPRFTVQYFEFDTTDRGEILLKENDLFATDYYPWQAGDNVMLIKKNITFPTGVYDSDTPITSDNIEQPENSSDYYIAPYYQQTG